MATGRLRRCRDSICRVLQFVDRIGWVASGIFDRSASKSGGGGESNGLGAAVGRMTEPVLKIGRDGKVGSFDDLRGILQDVVAGDFRRGVDMSDGKRIACAGCRESFVAECG